MVAGIIGLVVAHIVGHLAYPLGLAGLVLGNALLMLVSVHLDYGFVLLIQVDIQLMLHRLILFSGLVLIICQRSSYIDIYLHQQSLAP